MAPTTMALLADAQRFRVTNCPWLKGRIMRWSPGGVTVKFDLPNRPFTDEGVPSDDDDLVRVGNYTGVMCLSSRTEVTEI